VRLAGWSLKLSYKQPNPNILCAWRRSGRELSAVAAFKGKLEMAVPKRPHGSRGSRGLILLGTASNRAGRKDAVLPI
jgi:hypothetical protein